MAPRNKHSRRGLRPHPSLVRCVTRRQLHHASVKDENKITSTR